MCWYKWKYVQPRLKIRKEMYNDLLLFTLYKVKQMNILVCIKQVPDTTEIKIDPINNTLIRNGVPSIVNPFDACALEMAVRLKESSGGKVTVISMGPSQAVNALKECLSVGADKAYLITDRAFGGSDTLATSYILSSSIKALEEKNNEKFDLIFCGKQAIDGDTAQVGPEIAEHLGYGQVTCVTEIEEGNNSIIAKHDTDDGYEIIEAVLPAVLTVTKTSFEPRFPTIKSKLAANRATVESITASDMTIDLSKAGLKGSPTKVKKTHTPTITKSNVIIEESTAVDSANKLVNMLSNSGII